MVNIVVPGTMPVNVSRATIVVRVSSPNAVAMVLLSQKYLPCKYILLFDMMYILTKELMIQPVVPEQTKRNVWLSTCL